MKQLKEYIKLAKDNPKITAGIIIAIIVIYALVT